MKLKTVLFAISLTTISTSHAQWVNTNGPDSVQTLAEGRVQGGDYQPSVLVGGTNGYGYKYEDPFWNRMQVGPGNSTNVLVLAFGPNYYLFAGTLGKGVYRSNMLPPLFLDTGLTNYNVRAFAFSNTNICAGTDSGVFLSTNNGANWAAASNGLMNLHVHSLGVSGSNLFAGTEGGVFLSANNGANWINVSTGLTNSIVRTIAISGTNVFAGTDGGVFLSINNGTTWTAASNGLKSLHIRTFLVSGVNLFAGSDSGVFRTTNNGANWTAVNTGLTSLSVRTFAVYSGSITGTNLFAGTDGGIWRRPLPEVVSVENFRTTPSTHVTFNPNHSISISFSLPARSFISLKVFDLSGKSVAVLLSEEMPAGSYTRRINTAALPNNLCFLRLEAAAFKETKKVLLTR